MSVVKSQTEGCEFRYISTKKLTYEKEILKKLICQKIVDYK